MTRTRPPRAAGRSDVGHKAPATSPELLKRIRMVRRDIGDLLFHFTKQPPPDTDLTVRRGLLTTHFEPDAYGVLRKILADAELRGTGTWSAGHPVVCFTEAPIQEFSYTFSLDEFAADESQRPRYEPYGVAVPKIWLFQQGGRPVVYDHPGAINTFPEPIKYRFVPYDPVNGPDTSWEREWRIRTGALRLDPKHTLVVVPSVDQAVILMQEESTVTVEPEHEHGGGGIIQNPNWLVVSLDLFGYRPTK